MLNLWIEAGSVMRKLSIEMKMAPVTPHTYTHIGDGSSEGTLPAQCYLGLWEFNL